MKIKFNLKLTAFLVSLFLGLLLVILGSKNSYCLSFGLMVLGLSLEVFIWYNNERIAKAISDIDAEIDQINSVEVEDEELEEERVYILQQFVLQQKKLIKKKKSIYVVFGLCGFVLIILGFVNLFWCFSSIKSVKKFLI